ncbi:MAG: hypothetical protein HKL99_15310 [Burkholderiales bacterium]|jgi:hypothetical protein|nr:hypothetical protein [Burkholderiales bacterium]
MNISPLTHAEIEAAHARADQLQLHDMPDTARQLEVITWRAAEWREHKRRAEWWDKVILRASVVGIVAIVVLLGAGVMR